MLKDITRRHFIGITLASAFLLSGGRDRVYQVPTHVDKINSNALEWLDTLDVNPILKKGKKKFAELLDIYLNLYTSSSDDVIKQGYKSKVQDLTRITTDKRYHNLGSIDEIQFRQDNTSYLKIWNIMNEFDLNTRMYTKEIKKILHETDVNLLSRGVHQQMIFSFYFDKLDYDPQISNSLEELADVSVIRRHLENPSIRHQYDITHEVFALYALDRMDLIESDLDYLKELTSRKLDMMDIDILAEFIIVANNLNFKHIKGYDRALDFLSKSQNPNGSFGDYEDKRAKWEKEGKDIDIGMYLHTTSVALGALNQSY